MAKDVVRQAARAAAAAFHSRRWTWGDEEDPPSVDRIEAALWQRIGVLQDADNEELWAASSGRLRAQREENDVRLFLELGCLREILATDPPERIEVR